MLYQDCKRSRNGYFWTELEYELSKLDVHNIQDDHFINLIPETLNKPVSVKQNYARE